MCHSACVGSKKVVPIDMEWSRVLRSFTFTDNGFPLLQRGHIVRYYGAVISGTVICGAVNVVLLFMVL